MSFSICAAAQNCWRKTLGSGWRTCGKDRMGVIKDKPKVLQWKKRGKTRKLATSSTSYLSHWAGAAPSFWLCRQQTFSQSQHLIMGLLLLLVGSHELVLNWYITLTAFSVRLLLPISNSTISRWRFKLPRRFLSLLPHALSTLASKLLPLTGYKIHACS